MSEAIFEEYKAEYTETLFFLVSGWALTVIIAFVLGFGEQKFKQHADTAWCLSFLFVCAWIGLATLPGHQAALDEYFIKDRFHSFGGFRFFFSLALIMFVGCHLQRHPAQIFYEALFSFLVVVELSLIEKATRVFITNTTQTE
jgi:hypothetical protein